LIFGNVVANGGLFLVHLTVLLGSLNMLRVRSYSSALTAAIVSLIPFCSPVVLLGLPFGIWALAVLRREEVKEAFYVR
jgi:hypothetical protein